MRRYRTHLIDKTYVIIRDTRLREIMVLKAMSKLILINNSKTVNKYVIVITLTGT